MNWPRRDTLVEPQRFKRPRTTYGCEGSVFGTATPAGLFVFGEITTQQFTVLRTERGLSCGSEVTG